MKLQRRNFESLGTPLGPYVHAVAHNHTLYTSGLTAFGTQAQQGDICQQAHAIFNQLEIIAKQQGTSLQLLIKVTIFVTDVTHIAQLRDYLFEYYGEHLPASALIKIESLFAPELLIEVEAILAL
jgi:2-iminobutanoate/2-iminopropanoate deaminase